MRNAGIDLVPRSPERKLQALFGYPGIDILEKKIQLKPLP
jgi:hypothetical protein